MNPLSCSNPIWGLNDGQDQDKKVFRHPKLKRKRNCKDNQVKIDDSHQGLNFAQKHSKNAFCINATSKEGSRPTYECFSRRGSGIFRKLAEFCAKTPAPSLSFDGGDQFYRFLSVAFSGSLLRKRKEQGISLKKRKKSRLSAR